MFKLEKVFQNDDCAYIFFCDLIKSIVIFLSFYIFSILENNSIHNLLNFEYFLNSKYFDFSIIFFLIFFFTKRINANENFFKRNFISFIKEDLYILIVTNCLIFTLFYIFEKNFLIDKNFIYLLIFIIFNLSISKLSLNFFYDYLIKENIIQKNIMLVGNYNEIKNLLKNKFNEIYVFKCCIILDIKNLNESIVKSEIKFPIFKNQDDIRSILEYHALGQVWLLDTKKNKIEESLLKILKYSVDILIIDLEDKQNLKSKKLLANKFVFEHYEISRFFGINLFLKILFDKILSIIFIIISSPIIILSMFLIYIEDGFPLIFTQNRTGWDGRRFKIYKLRSLKKETFDKTVQVIKGDKRVLKCGNFLRRYSIDELPQLLNVLNGDMSIVGPRPHMVEHDIQYSNLFDNFLKRHKCNPGITGWAQVNGLRGGTPNPESMKKRMEFDLWYLNNWSIWLDIYIIFKTFYALIKYKGD